MLSDDEPGDYTTVSAAIDAARQQGAPDDAPTCDQPGCDRLGVLVQTVTTTDGTRTWHWCLTHDPDD